jgi:serine/threonine protein kinase
MVGLIPFDNYLQFAKLGGKLTEDNLPSKVNKNVEPWVDELCQRTIVLDSSERWANIDEIRQFIFEKGLATKFSNGSQPDTNTSLDDLKPTDMITNDITLGELLGEGGFSKVFKAKHSMMPGKVLAAKIFKEGISPRAAIDEFQALANLQHENIVKFVFNGTTNGGLFFTLMDYVNGQDIRRYTMGDMFFPLPLIYQFLQEMLSALIYMQEQQPPIIHRDIKPENIIYTKEGKFVLIDFNIATANEKDKHKVGTWPYLAPDLETGSKMKWDKSADTFALGVTLFELVSHLYPWPGKQRTPVLDKKPVDISQQNSQISDAFAAFIMKACDTRSSNRFADAQSMLDALNAIGKDGIIKPQTVSHYNTENEELHIVDYINSLYSQSTRGNAGTRAGWKGNHLLDVETYTKTKLDTKLLSAIEEGKYKLVIITGNAGDGKTAFIRRVEELGTNIELFDSHNGARFDIGGIKYESNYDGSQDENNLKNIDVLRQFFSPFVGLTNFNEAKEGRIIAINEGRLIEYLEASPEHKFLYDAIDEYFYKEGVTPLPEGVMVINLNLRSVTALNEQRESLFRQQVKALTAKALWSKCETCPLGNKCFIKYNVDSLSDSAVGSEIISRLEWIVRTIVYKREVHITMRDIRSMIAWLITRDFSCQDIPNIIQKEAELTQTYEDAVGDEAKMIAKLNLDLYTQQSWLRYYFNVTSPDSKLYNDLQSEDRIVKLLQETDIASVSIPDRDRDLYYRLQSENDYLTFAERKQSLIKAFNDTCDIRPSYLQSKEEIMLLKMRHKALIRYQYFEGKANFMDRMPYHSIGRFYKELNLDTDKREDVKNWLSYAISCSEGCWNKDLSKNHLLLSSSRIVDPSGKSYRRFPLSDFELTVDTNNKLTEYLEHENDSFIFRSKTKKHIQLNVSLDLYEMLYYISNGFSPSVSDLKGRFIELQVFKNLLESETYTEVIVTNNEKNYYRISLDKSCMKLFVEPLNTEE